MTPCPALHVMANGNEKQRDVKRTSLYEQHTPKKTNRMLTPIIRQVHQPFESLLLKLFDTSLLVCPELTVAGVSDPRPSHLETATQNLGNQARSCSCSKSRTELNRFGTTVVTGCES